MSARTPTLLLRSGLLALPERLPRLQRTEIEAPPERRVVASWAMTMLAVCLLMLVANVLVIGNVQHYLAQRHLYADFRQSLAEGSVPTGQTDLTGELVKPGTPGAQLSIPSLGSKEIGVEGTTSWQTMDGVGHERDTSLPGQSGVSVLMGRAASYGGVFKHLDHLQEGASIDVLTQQGTATYEVIGVRGKTADLPPDRLTLATAKGSAYRPKGVTLVDARLVSTAFGKPPIVFSNKALSKSEQVLKGDWSHTFALSWMLELLALLLVAAIWSWKRWSKAATWLVFAPVLATLGLAVATAVCGMLPNLM